MSDSRTQKTFLNARVNFIFYFLTLIISFVSRKIFLSNLGDDFIGLTGTLYNILGFLNLAELGISTSIAFLLYKPIFAKDQQQINEIISVFGFIYSVIGKVILSIGIIISCFIPLIFGKTTLPLGIIYFAYYAFLSSSLFSYFINYKQILLGADQRNYVITGYYQSSLIVKNLLQLIICYYSHNYYIWVGIELIFSILYCILLNWKIYQVYPWLKADLKLGKKLFKKYPEIVTKTKQVFVQRIAFTILTQTITPLIYAYSTLQTVALYGNYMILIEKGASLINMTMSGANAGIGNLIAEGNNQRIISVFWELRAFRYWMAFNLVFAFYYFMEPFICLWLGGEYIMERYVLIIILINIFIGQTRIVVMGFLNGYGLFKDIWSPIAEAALNIGTAIVLGSLYGIGGVLLGATVSLLLIICIWKPYFLYKEGFKLSVMSYWYKTSIYFILSMGGWIILHLTIIPLIDLNGISSFREFILDVIILVPLYALLTWCGYYLMASGMKNFTNRMLRTILRK